MTTLALMSTFNTTTGYGSDGVGLATALVGQGRYDVNLIPIRVTPPINDVTAALLTKTPPPHIDLGLMHTDVFALNKHNMTMMRRGTDRLVWWSMWEFSTFEAKGRTTLKKKLQGLDTFLAYDHVTAEAFGPYLPSYTDVKILQGGYDPRDVPYIPRDWSEDAVFRYCMVGQLGIRKNPFAAVAAFNLLKKEHGDDFNAELHLKTTTRTLHPKMEEAYPGIKIHYALWPRQQLMEFYAGCHCYLAPSYGEGKNIPALEAATTGMAVAATNFGGHTGWLRADLGYPVPYEEMQLFRGSGMGASVNPRTLADIMWHVYTHRDEARMKGERAARTLPAMMSWDSVVKRLGDML